MGPPQEALMLTRIHPFLPLFEPFLHVLSFSRFAVQWTGYVLPFETGDYVFGVRSDDGFRLYLGGNFVMSYWGIRV